MLHHLGFSPPRLHVHTPPAANETPRSPLRNIAPRSPFVNEDARRSRPHPRPPDGATEGRCNLDSILGRLLREDHQKGAASVFARIQPFPGMLRNAGASQEGQPRANFAEPRTADSGNVHHHHHRHHHHQQQQQQQLIVVPFRRPGHSHWPLLTEHLTEEWHNETSY